jgi:Flp pilus assembly protein TadB
MPVVAALGAGLATWALLTGVLGLVLGVASAAVTWRAVARMEPRAERRRRDRLTEALPYVVDLMAACLAVGDSPGGALDRVASAVDDPMCSELRAVAARLRLGADSVAVWREVSRHPQLGPLGRCLLRATESGAPVSEAMTRLAEDVRRDSRAEVEARARAVGVRATAPLGVCLLPAFVVVGVVPLVAGSVSVLVLR